MKLLAIVWVFKFPIAGVAWALWGTLLVLLLVRQRRVKPYFWNIGWILWWFTFAAVWTENWTNIAELWTVGWFFDSIGHYVFGITACLNVVYLYRTYWNPRPLSGKKLIWRVAFGLANVLIILALGWFWEIFENVWDGYIQKYWFPWLGKTQKDQIDTIIDIATNPAGALTALKFYYPAERWWYRTFYTDALEEAELDELLEEFEENRRNRKSLRKRIGEIRWKMLVAKRFSRRKRPPRTTLPSPPSRISKKETV